MSLAVIVRQARQSIGWGRGVLHRPKGPCARANQRPQFRSVGVRLPDGFPLCIMREFYEARRESARSSRARNDTIILACSSFFVPSLANSPVYTCFFVRDGWCDGTRWPHHAACPCCTPCLLYNLVGNRLAGCQYRPNQAKQFRSMAHGDRCAERIVFRRTSTTTVHQSHAVPPWRLSTS